MDGAVRGTRLGVMRGWRVVRLLLLQNRKGKEKRGKGKGKKRKKEREREEKLNHSQSTVY